MLLKAKCPLCRKPSTQGDQSFPFCSERCQLMDLGKWADEEYRIPGETLDELPVRREEDADDEASRR